MMKEMSKIINGTYVYIKGCPNMEEMRPQYGVLPYREGRHPHREAEGAPIGRVKGAPM